MSENEYGILGVIHDKAGCCYDESVNSARQEWVEYYARQYEAVFSEQFIGYEHLGQSLSDHRALRLPPFLSDGCLVNLEYRSGWVRALEEGLVTIVHMGYELCDAGRLLTGALSCRNVGKRALLRTLVRLYWNISASAQHYAAAAAAEGVLDGVWPLDFPETYLEIITRRRSKWMALETLALSDASKYRRVLIVCGLSHAADLAQWLLDPRTEDRLLAYNLYQPGHPILAKNFKAPRY